MTQAAKHLPEAFSMDRNFALEAIRVTESAAIAASKWMGLGDEKAADQAAVNAMRETLNGLAIDGMVVIGEGERDKAPMLYIGEKVGAAPGKGPKIDIALDPLEGTTLCAHGAPNALAVLAMADAGGFLHAPDVYMDKIAVGGGLPEGVVDLDNALLTNLKNLAKAKKCEVSDLVACILLRDRHAEIIAKVRESGARIQLITDGDVAGVMATSRPHTGIDIYMGTRGAPEGVLAAAALQCIGGQMQGRLIFRDEDEKARATRLGITDLSKKYTMHDLAHGNVMFAATGVTDGSMLKGVSRFASGATTQSIVMRSSTGTVRIIETHHNFTPQKLDGGVIFPAIDPVALQLGPLAIRWYSLAYLAGILLGWWVLKHLNRTHPLANFSSKALDDVVMYATLGIVLGGRLGYCLFYNTSHYLAHPLEILQVWHGGMSFHGGCFGLAFALYLLCRKHKIPYLGLMDRVALIAPIGLFFGRIANFINGELYGRVTDSPFGMVFPHGGELPRHPSQLYQAGLEGVLLGLVLLACWKPLRDKRGALSGAFLIGYGVFRMIGETFREPDAQLGFLVAGATMGQLLSVPMLALGVFLVYRAWHESL